jgi:hypothetical protein
MPDTRGKTVVRGRKSLPMGQKKGLFVKSGGGSSVPGTEQIALTRNSVLGTGY